MKKNDDAQQENGKFSNILKKASDLGAKTVDLGKKAADGIQSGAKALSEKAKNDSYLRRLKKFNPLFPKDYKTNTKPHPGDVFYRGQDPEGNVFYLCTL